jgi:hypothetical protein
MKTPLSRRGWLAVAASAGLVAPLSLRAGSINLDFNDGLVPAGTAVLGSAVVEATGGFVGGALKIVKNVNSQQGGFMIEDLDGGGPINGFEANFKMRAGGGTTPPADGWSFCLGNDLPDSAWSEEGPTTTGLVVAFDLYDNGAAEAPAITIRWNGAVVQEVKPAINLLLTGEAGTPLWADVRIFLDTDGTLDVSFDGVTHIENLVISDFAPIEGGRYGFGARTGGANMNVFVDDLALATSTGALRASLVHQPQSSTFVAGSRARFFALLTSETPVVGYQWLRKEPGGADFLPIGGATSRDFVSTDPVGAGDSGAVYRLAVTDGGGVILSDEATLTVGALPEPVFEYTADFNDGQPPPQSTVFPSALVDPGGFLQLTDAQNDLSGAFLINDLDAGASISSIFAAFDVRMGSGTLPPADGFSFNWGLGLTAGPVVDAEEGSGTGLRVCFDVYDNTDANPLNGVGEAPALVLKWGTQELASVKVSPYEFFTDLEFMPVRVRLESSGAVSISMNGRLYFQNVIVPGWTAIAGGEYGFYARTGGANQKHEIDNVQLATTTYAGPVAITAEPADLIGVAGQPATFTVGANYATPPATVQWQRKAPGDPDFANITGATNATLVTDPTTAANSGTLYRATVSFGGSSDTSREALLTVVDFGSPGGADVVLNFNSGDLTNTGSAAGAEIATYGLNVAFAPTGGPDDSGYLSITEAAEGQVAALVVENFSGASAQGSLQVNFDLTLTGAGSVGPEITPADGFSVNWGDNVPAGVIGEAENGAGTGLSITFDTYDNGGLEAPAVGIKWRGAYVVPELPITRAFFQPQNWVKFGIRVENDGTIDVMFNNVVLFNNVALPNWSGLANGRFNIAARTGGAWQTHWVDNVVINTANYVGPISLTQQPQDIGVLAGTPAEFTAAINDPAQTTWQWQSAPAGSPDFTNIPTATSNTYTTPATTLADNGRQYRVIATGQNSSVTSEIAVLTVIDPVLPAPTATLDFDTASSLTYAFAGSGTEGDGEGVGGSRFGSLTTATNSLTGVLMIDDFNDGQPVNSMYASFDLRIGGGSATPADGVSFVWANDIGNTSTLPLPQFGEEGSGNGLTVSFDTYQNGLVGGVFDEPGIKLNYQGTTLAEKPMPFASFLSDPDYYRAVVRVESDGTADVFYNNELIFYNVPLPGFTPVSGAVFAWGGRTGGLNQNNFLDNIALFTTVAPPVSTDVISIAVSGGNLVLTYTGTLQSSTNLATNSWQTVAGATSPYIIPLPASGTLYFRAGR